ncbi:MAG: MurR/RpiR family transcriptional regulator [Erysipelotrichaceae bacterium]|nr:MurR/RpiR family transcriptional regulator [Erysipelotrichaceae bacterium]
MNIFTKIKQKNNFTNMEQVVADYILKYPQEVIDKDIKSLSQSCYVSTSTIYRFLDKLELQGLSELKVLISSQYKEYQYEQENIDYNYPFKKYDTHYQIAAKMSQLYDQTVAATKNLIDLEELLKVVQQIDKANRITIFPSVGNIYAAENFQHNMKDIGIHVDVETIPYLQYMSAVPLTKDDLAIVISYANRGTAMGDIVKELKRQNVPIVLISSTLPNDLFSYATYHLFFCSYEDTWNKIASFATKISLQYLLDTLYACYFNRHYDDNIEFKRKYKKTL